MQPFREDMAFLKGLFNEQAARHKSPHMGRMANWLSGAWVSAEQGEIRAGRTMDQVLAQRLGGRTAIPSLVPGIEPTELRLEDGLADDLRFVHLPGRRHPAGDQGDLPRASSTGSSATPPAAGSTARSSMRCSLTRPTSPGG
jgi:hypothetical protein